MENSKSIPINPPQQGTEQPVRTETRREELDRESTAQNMKHLIDASGEEGKAAVEAETDQDFPPPGSKANLERIRKMFREQGLMNRPDPEELKRREADPEYQARRKQIRELFNE